MFERKCKNKLNFLFFPLPLFYSLLYKDCVVMSLMWSFTPFSTQLKLRYEGFCRMVIAERASVIWRMPVRDILLQICHITGLVAKAGIIMSLPSVNNFICIRCLCVQIFILHCFACVFTYDCCYIYLDSCLPPLLPLFAIYAYSAFYYFFFQIFFLSLVVVVLYFILLLIVFSENLNFMVLLFPSVLFILFSCLLFYFYLSYYCFLLYYFIFPLINLSSLLSPCVYVCSLSLLRFTHLHLLVLVRNLSYVIL